MYVVGNILYVIYLYELQKQIKKQESVGKPFFPVTASKKTLIRQKLQYFEYFTQAVIAVVLLSFFHWTVKDE
jgi:hypothetical protein